MAMWKLFIKKLFMFMLTVFIMSFLIFVSTRILPGDPIRLMFGDKDVSPEIEARIRDRYHLNESVISQYFLCMGEYLQGDFGDSYFYSGKSVVSVIGKGFLVTLRLTLFVFPIASLAGLCLGFLSSYYAERWPDKIINALVIAVTAIPSVPLATFLVYLFAVKLRCFPIAGWGDFRHMILPAIFMSIWPSLSISKLVRSLVLEELGKPYVYMCRTRGMGKARIILREVFGNIRVPLFTRLSMMFGGMLEGSLIAEVVFNIPGMGRKSLEAVTRRDYPIILATVLLSTVIYTAINYTLELVQMFSDPRLHEVQKKL